MKSKASFFDMTLFKKNITRFAPVWVLYAVGLTIGILLCSVADTPQEVAFGLEGVTNLMMMANAGYAFVCGAVLFGDMYRGQLSFALHAFPLRREGRFLTNYVTGLLFSFVPTTLALPVLLLLTRGYEAAALSWWAVTCLEFVFAFGVAAFAAFCAGNRLGYTAVYGLIHFASELVHVFLTVIFEPLLYGVKLDLSLLDTLCPVYHLTAEGFFETVRYEKGEHFIINGSTWRYLGILAAVGIVLAGCALLIYRIRHLESAGNFIALKPVGVVFLLVFTISCGVFLYAFSSLFIGEGGYIFFAIGITVGYFTGRMLLERTSRVFGKKNILGFGILAVVLAVTMVATYRDPAHLVNFVPEAPVSVTMSLSGEDYKATDAREIAEIQNVHTVLLEEHTKEIPDEEVFYFYEVSLNYIMPDGSHIIRNYPLSEKSKAWLTVQKYADSLQCIFQVENWDEICEKANVIDAYSYSDEEFPGIAIGEASKIRGLIKAMERDFEEGHIFNPYFHNDEEYVFTLDISGDERYWHIEISEKAVNTMNWLRAYISPKETP